MRIVAGEFGGRSIEAPAGTSTRPTTDRVREALFSSLYSLRGGFQGAVVLDAFAGSGALGLEALSRGAESAVFLERDPKAASVVSRNVKACGLDGARARVERRDALQAPASTFACTFDLVFLDPPYEYPAADVLKMVSELGCAGSLRQGTLVVYEHAQKSADQLLQAADDLGFQLAKSKKYGKTGITVLVWDPR